MSGATSTSASEPAAEAYDSQQVQSVLLRTQVRLSQGGDVPLPTPPSPRFEGQRSACNSAKHHAGRGIVVSATLSNSISRAGAARAAVSNSNCQRDVFRSAGAVGIAGGVDLGVEYHEPQPNSRPSSNRLRRLKQLPAEASYEGLKQRLFVALMHALMYDG